MKTVLIHCRLSVQYVLLSCSLSKHKMLWSPTGVRRLQRYCGVLWPPGSPTTIAVFAFHSRNKQTETNPQSFFCPPEWFSYKLDELRTLFILQSPYYFALSYLYNICRRSVGLWRSINQDGQAEGGDGKGIRSVLFLKPDAYWQISSEVSNGGSFISASDKHLALKYAQLSMGTPIQKQPGWMKRPEDQDRRRSQGQDYGSRRRATTAVSLDCS